MAVQGPAMACTAMPGHYCVTFYPMVDDSSPTSTTRNLNGVPILEWGHPVYVPEHRYAGVLPYGYKRATTGYSKTINSRATLGYPKWGFVIYRGTYGDDARWEKAIALLKYSTDYWLRHNNQVEVLGPDLVWTIIEDRETLDGATKEAVRTRFRKWAADRSVERDGPGADGRWLGKRSPRFRACVYIDQASLDSLTARWMHTWNYWALQGQVAIIDGTHGRHDAEVSHIYEDEDEDEVCNENEDEDEGYEPIEGNTAKDVGWRYVDAAMLARWYEDLHLGGTEMEWENWHYFYAGRRPYGPVVESPGDSLEEVDLTRGDGLGFMASGEGGDPRLS